MTSAEVKELYGQFVLPTYRQTAVCLVKGKGSRVWDIHGKEYLDFFPGWGVSGLGHCHPKVVSAIKHQAGKILHIPNNFLNLKQAELGRVLVKKAFPGKVFFCSSGAEAVEGAIKCAHKFGAQSGRYEIITMDMSFHGRTIAALTATAQPKVQDGFGPLPEGFRYARFNDLDSVKALVSAKTVAIMLEPVQGEGGIRVAGGEFLKGLRKLADEKNLLLIFDEIQCGMGRTGKLFAYEHWGVIPDIMVLAKSLGAGVPIGAFITGKKCVDVLTPGSHGSTYGGNPLVAAAALAVLKAIDRERLLARTQEMGAYLREKLMQLKASHLLIKEVRGLGLMLGVELSKPGASVFERCLEKGLIINCTQEKVLRIMPAMAVTKRQIDQALRILGEVLTEEEAA
ncbi:MAG: aspartate aminotransferase family protein [Candidatus Omnitrophica bacterium]|nr:aspartate aminotransferase family protein [Candidatus Omnitrophota bacterium]